ncbi:hypothetical protein [Nocardia farcinica]|uniref:hypothetical protein n=1 Tax=Nocardia farcinica TaxID=37329 RepID=UPI0018945C82|nr:hypothetical protein [Nocardia farcinica]MBF6385724.1 hypothetical protein [Nocardia farcinica]MBF6540626.1 hypothetical protein [Nocardia farcinica]
MHVSWCERARCTPHVTATPTAPPGLGLSEPAAVLAAGTVRSTTVVRAALDGIEASLPRFDAFRVVWRVAALATPTAGVRLPPPGVPVAIEGDTDIARVPTAFGCGSLPGRDRRRRGGVAAARSAGVAGGAVPGRALFTAACPTRGPGPCSAEPSVNVRAGGRTSAAVTAEHTAMSTTVACRSARS